MTDSSSRINYADILRRFIKYLIVGLVVGLAAVLLLKSKKDFSVRDVIILGLVAMITFALVDLYSPSEKASTQFDLVPKFPPPIPTL